MSACVRLLIWVCDMLCDAVFFVWYCVLRLCVCVFVRAFEYVCLVCGLLCGVVWHG